MKSTYFSYGNIKIFFLLWLVMLASACTANQPGEEALSEICEIFTEIEESGLPKESRSSYAYENIASRVTNNDVKGAFEAISSLDQQLQYPIFKEAAEAILEKTWDCPSMKYLISPQDK